MSKAMKVTMKDQDRLRAWAAPYMGIETIADDMVMLGVLRGDDIIGAIGFNAFYDDQATIHVASNGRRDFLSRLVLKAVFGYAFSHRNVRRLNVVVPVWNRQAQVLALKIGGVPEGYLRKAATDGGDAVLFGILREECPYFLRFHGGSNGQERT